MPQLQVMLAGAFEPSRFLALIRDFIVFEDDGGALNTPVFQKNACETGRTRLTGNENCCGQQFGINELVMR